MAYFAESVSGLALSRVAKSPLGEVSDLKRFQTMAKGQKADKSTSNRIQLI